MTKVGSRRASKSSNSETAKSGPDSSEPPKVPSHGKIEAKLPPLWHPCRLHPSGKVAVKQAKPNESGSERGAKLKPKPTTNVNTLNGKSSELIYVH